MTTIKIAVVIPCRNEAPFIEECIRAVYAADLPDNTELVVSVVDGKSDDGTLNKLAALQTIFPNLEVVENSRQLTPFAFNLGIEAVPDADYYQIIGARHIISPNYLSTCLQILQSDPSIWCVGGKIINEYLTEESEYIAKAVSVSFGMGLGNFRTLSKSGFTDTVTSPMYPAWVFEKIGLFDSRLARNQDDDFNFRVHQAGGKVFFSADISLRYYVRGNNKQLWKQFYQYGYWKVFVNRKHKAVTTFRQLIPPLFVLFLFSLPLAFFPIPWVGLIQVFFLSIYMVLCIVFGDKLGTTRPERSQIASVFPILHISYGLGYLKGVWRFLILRKDPEESASKLSR